MKSRRFPLLKLFTRQSVPDSTRLNGQAARPRRRSWLSLEELESRLVLSLYTVLTNGNATGPVSGGPVVYTAPTLRAAIDAANLAGGINAIFSSLTWPVPPSP
jgi:hypothetical protein